MKILYVTTISNTVNAFLIPHIMTLFNQGHQVDVAFRVEREVKSEIYEMGCKVHEIPFQRSPLSKDNFKAYKILKEIIIDGKYDLVHTHTPVASAIVRLVCRKTKDIKVIYTAHGFHFFKGAPIQNWLIYYYVEKWLSSCTDVLITINKEDYQRAKKSFKVGRVEYIPGVGIDVDKFANVTVDKTAKRKELNLPEDAFVVLSVGELNKNKNHEIIIKAIAKLNNPNIYYVICGQGPLENYLKNLAYKIDIGNQVKLLGFRKDIPEILKAADVFAFPSLREGLGLSAIEAMLGGLPLITSNVHGINDYSTDGVTGYKCSPNDVDGFATAIKKLIKSSDECAKMGTYNRQYAKKYDVHKIIPAINKIYNSEILRVGGTTI
jgi:glycosyltransferase involved in cell wall biosynthesis